MIDPLTDDGPGQTLLGPDDRRGLKPTWVRTRHDLNEAEQANIIRALSRMRPPAKESILDDLWLRELHRMMFGEVWSWAGSYRTRQTNLGIDPDQVAPAVRNLAEDARLWSSQEADATVVGARFHHRLTLIHPFPNGNGRHARAAASFLVQALAGPRLSWGRGYGDTNLARTRYLGALRAADRGDLEPLVAFVTS